MFFYSDGSTSRNIEFSIHVFGNSAKAPQEGRKKRKETTNKRPCSSPVWLPRMYEDDGELMYSPYLDPKSM